MDGAGKAVLGSARLVFLGSWLRDGQVGGVLEMMAADERSLDSFRITKGLFWKSVLEYQSSNEEKNDWIQTISSDKCRNSMAKIIESTKKNI